MALLFIIASVYLSNLSGSICKQMSQILRKNMRGNFLFLYFLNIINGDDGFSLRLVFSFEISTSEETKSTDFC